MFTFVVAVYYVSLISGVLSELIGIDKYLGQVASLWFAFDFDYIYMDV